MFVLKRFEKVYLTQLDPVLGYKGAFKNHITQILPFVDPPHLTQLSLLGQPPSPYLSLFITLVAFRFSQIYAIFMCFLCVFIIFLHKSQIFGVISLIVHPPPYHSNITLGAKPPLLVSDMIFERSLSNITPNI